MTMIWNGLNQPFGSMIFFRCTWDGLPYSESESDLMDS